MSNIRVRESAAVGGRQWVNGRRVAGKAAERQATLEECPSGSAHDVVRKRQLEDVVAGNIEPESDRELHGILWLQPLPHLGHL